MQQKANPTVCVDASRRVLTSPGSPTFATADRPIPDTNAACEILAEYPDSWSLTALGAAPSGRGQDNAGAAGLWSDYLLRFVLEARNWCLVDLVFALREDGDERGARLLAEELLALCPRLNRGAIRRLRKIDHGAVARTGRTTRCGREAST